MNPEERTPGSKPNPIWRIAEAMAWSAYRDAGFPLGKTKAGLLIWINFKTATTVN